MNFRIFTTFATDVKVAVDVQSVIAIYAGNNGGTVILLSTGATVRVKEDFDVVVSALNTIAE